MSDSIAFDRAVEYYDATHGFKPEQEQQITDGMAAALGQLNGPVLELGIGTGRIAIPLQQRGYTYYGVDLSLPMMNRLRENSARRGTASIPLVQGDVTRLPYKDGSFVAIVAVHVFHLVPSWREAISEARRVLQPNGVILHAGHAIPNHGNDTSPMNTKWRELLQAEGYTLNRPSSSDIAPDVEAALRGAGAKQIDTTIAATWSDSSTPHQDYDRLASRRWSGTWNIPDDIFNRTITQLHDWMLQEYGDRYDTQETGKPEEFFITKAQF